MFYKIRTLFFILTFFIVSCFPLRSVEVFTIDRLSILFSQPSYESKKLGYVPRNSEVSILEQINSWYKIEFDGKQGWIFKSYPHPDRLEISSINVRKRASNFTSSAAAGRGLANENARDRNNVSFRNYDFESILWLETNFCFNFEILEDFFEKEIKKISELSY